MARGGRIWSDWELSEMDHLHRCGWTARSLATLYGCSERAIQRRLRAMRAERPADMRSVATQTA